VYSADWMTVTTTPRSLTIRDDWWPRNKSSEEWNVLETKSHHIIIAGLLSVDNKSSKYTKSASYNLGYDAACLHTSYANYIHNYANYAWVFVLFLLCSTKHESWIGLNQGRQMALPATQNVSQKYSGEGVTKIRKLGGILRKIIKIVATRCHILSLKRTKFDFSWGSAPHPAGGAHNTPPELLTGYEGVLLLREGKRMGGKRKVRWKERKGKVASRLLGGWTPLVLIN